MVVRVALFKQGWLRWKTGLAFLGWNSVRNGGNVGEMKIWLTRVAKLRLGVVGVE
jgi:hypothetical protein